MFDKTKVEDSLVGIVGVRNPSNPTYAIIDAANQLSTSGYFVNDIPLAKIEYFKEAQDYEAISDADFNELLRTTQKSAIVSVCNQVFNTNDFQDRNLFYKRPNNNIEAETLIDGFVGWKLQVKRKSNVAFKITRVILDFHSGIPEDITLQLYNTGTAAPIQSKVITVSANNQEEVLNWVVDNSDTTYKGDYYLGYIKTATTPIPYRRNYQSSSIISKIEGLTIEPMQVTGHSTNVLFDLTTTEGLSENIGVNPDIIIYDDYTDFIKQNRSIFAHAIQIDMAIRMMNVSASSNRVNKDQRINDSIQVKIFQSLNGADIGEGRLKVQSLNAMLIGEIANAQTAIAKLKGNYFGGLIKVGTRT